MKSKEDYITITFCVERKIRQAIREKAAKEGINTSEWIRNTLNEKLSKKKV